ncbi:hypothetical protein [Candidatus Parabeggiatoa sp. HSG14]|uniref:hypothetical protein n=1 Tax=Candidatus Parabeggiatoa sp. HSG14 TaxID=3055593 RepID=UPI0025A92A5A|nr:hypothetical protein [Thiotrichales bacterium HSG14]
MHNKILAGAIVTALSLHAGVTNAAVILGATFENATEGAGLTESTTTAGEYTPDPLFDFAATDKVVRMPKSGIGGLTYATELFGTNSAARTLPSDDYAAAVYTVDGEIDTSFELTYTLSNGAAFSETPRIGIQDSGGGAFGDSGDTVHTLGSEKGQLDANAVTLYMRDTSSSALVIGDKIVIGSLDGSSISYVANTASSDHALSGVFQVNAIDGNYSSNGLASAVSDNIDVYVATQPTANLTQGNLSVVAADGLSFNTTACMAASISAGDWINFQKDTATCGAVKVSSVADNPANSIIQVGANITEKCGDLTEPQPLAVVSFTDYSTIYAPSTYAEGANEILTAANLTGASVEKDSALKFGGSDADTATNPSAVLTANQTSANIVLLSGLNGELTHGDTVWNSAATAGGNWAGSPATSTSPIIATKTNSAGMPSATFVVEASKDKLVTGDRIILLYKLNNADKLAAAGESIQMTVKLEKPLSAGGGSVHPSRSITIANGKNAIEGTMKPISTGVAKISVSSGELELSGTAGFTDTDSPYVTNTIAQIGAINFTSPNVNPTPTLPNGVLTSDGKSLFTLNNPDNTTDTNLKGSTLVVGTTDAQGQFQASTGTPGRVFVNLKGLNQIVDSTSVSNEFIATWDLDAALPNIVQEADGKSTIRFQVDGKTKINTVENDPVAKLEIKYENTKNRPLVLESPLRKLVKDGTTCWVYNIPGSAASDAMALRFTNDSTVVGGFVCDLYDKEGATLFEAQPLSWGVNDPKDTELQPGETVRVSAADVEAIAGATWAGRAIMKCTTTLPNMEMMLLLRDKSPGAPLTNISVGASGVSCGED